MSDDLAIVVYNHCHPTKPPTRINFNIPIDSSIRTLRDKIVEHVQYKEDTFTITLTKTSKLIPTKTDEDLAKDIAEYFNTESDNKCVVTLLRSENFDMKDQKMHFMYETPLHTSVATATAATGIRGEASDHKRSSSPPARSYNIFSNNNWHMGKSETGYCGLSNQGATCYLNSLLQTLYMTPEFRMALYNWSFDDFCRRSFEAKLEQRKAKAKEGATKGGGGGEDEMADESQRSSDDLFAEYKAKMEETSIPRQLQKLFLKLSTSDKRAVETKGLTKSFGWKQDDAFTQHDVQELCRVLFDALDTVWKGTEQANLINELYQGEMKDYVQCLSCGQESSRTDKYLDIPLVIKGFGQTTAVKSIEEALGKFIEPETLVGDNQYSCEKCGKKTDASKGLKFINFPYLLTLQLKRFDFDFSALRRIKLNDKVTFPDILDMNPFLMSSKVTARPPTEVTDKGEAQRDEEEADSTGAKKTENGEEPPDREEQIVEALSNGPEVYELFSILIHRGSALGGHYYAFVRSFRSGRWFEFNDSFVKEIAPDAIAETFGQESEKKSSFFFSSGTSAYMLMYRKCDPARNIPEPSTENLPESIKQLIAEENRLEEEKELEKERKKSLCTIKAHYKDTLKEFTFDKSLTVEEVKDRIAKELGLESFLPDNLRIREMYSDLPGEPVTEKQLKGSLKEFTHYYFPKNVYFETKEGSESWRKYNRFDTYLRVRGFSQESGLWTVPELYIVPQQDKVIDFKRALSAKYSIPLEKMVMVKEDYDTAKVVDQQQDDELVERLFLDKDLVFVELIEGNAKPRAVDELSRIKNAIEVHCTNPDQKEYVHKFQLDKRMTVLDLKKHIEKVVGLSIDEFKVFKVPSETWKMELRNEEETLGDCFFSTTRKIAVEKGKPFRHGEIQCKWLLLDINSEKKTELFELALPGKLPIKDVKEELVKHWKHLQSTNSHNKKIEFTDDPSRLRIRLVIGSRPSTIYPDHKPLSEVAGRFHFSASEVHVQLLPAGTTETKTSDDIVVIILKQFHPDTYQLGPAIEFDANKEEKLADFKERISKVTGIPNENLSLASCDGFDQKILHIPHLKWIPSPKSGEPTEKKRRNLHYDSQMDYEPSRLVRTLNLLEGEQLLYRDLTVELKKLTEEEEKQIKAEENKKKQEKMRQTYSSFSSRKEEKLDIKIADVSLADETIKVKEKN